MLIAKCPDCGAEVNDEDMLDDQVRLGLVVGMLMGAASVTGMMVTLPDYEAAREGYDERLGEVTERISQDVDAFVNWGEAYDG